MKKNRRDRLRKKQQRARRRQGGASMAGMSGRGRRVVVPANASNLPVNKRFNRLESLHDHYYTFSFGSKPLQDHVTPGWIKCRLLHGLGYSAIVPDQIFIDHAGLKWIQPLAFLPNVLGKFSDDDIVCDVPVDISCGNTLRVRFHNYDLVRSFPDGSQLYTCELRGPGDLYEYVTGDAEWNPDGTPYLHLYHHTTKDACPKILGCGHFRTGNDNIQGVAKKLKNVAYAYFTPLDEIQKPNDLKKIAMAEGGEIELRRDGFTPPPTLGPNWRSQYKNDILVLPVYPCSLAKRESQLDVFVDATVLAPQHIYRHDEGGPVYYEFPHEFIHRIGVEPGNTVAFDANRRLHRQAGLKSFDYIVVGDCRTLNGLTAPYDEEDTTHIMKIERMPAGKSMLNFWFEQGNQDLFTGKKVDMQEFQ